MIRQAAYAGRFYPSGARQLSSEVGAFLDVGGQPLEGAIGIVSPHAGYMYSGAVAGSAFASAQVADTYVLLGPNHTGLGAGMAIMSEGAWAVPSGIVNIDTPLARRIMAGAELLEEDVAAHIQEHSLEVQVPFVLGRNPSARIVPIAIMMGGVEELRELGRAVSGAIKGHKGSVLMVASSDMSHFISDKSARSIDRLALERIEALDPEGLYNVVRSRDISMCGVLPVTAMLFAALELGAGRAETLRYTTSAEASGDYDRVVGYAAVRVSA